MSDNIPNTEPPGIEQDDHSSYDEGLNETQEETDQGKNVDVNRKDPWWIPKRKVDESKVDE